MEIIYLKYGGLGNTKRSLKGTRAQKKRVISSLSRICEKRNNTSKSNYIEPTQTWRNATQRSYFFARYFSTVHFSVRIIYQEYLDVVSKMQQGA